MILIFLRKCGKGVENVKVGFMFGDFYIEFFLLFYIFILMKDYIFTENKKKERRYIIEIKVFINNIIILNIVLNEYEFF